MEKIKQQKDTLEKEKSSSMKTIEAVRSHTTLIHDISSDPYFMPSKHQEMTKKYKGRERRQDHLKK